MKIFAMLILLISNLLFSQDLKTNQLKNNISKNFYVSEVQNVTKELPSPNFNWKDEKGKVIDFQTFSRGKYIFLNFWATWCGPCKKEIPDLISLSTEFSNKNLQFIGISVDRDDDVLNLVKEFAIEQKINYPILIDNEGVANAFGGIRGIPTTFLINKEGKIVDKIVGMRPKEIFKESIVKLLAN